MMGGRIIAWNEDHKNECHAFDPDTDPDVSRQRPAVSRVGRGGDRRNRRTNQVPACGPRYGPVPARPALRGLLHRHFRPGQAPDQAWPEPTWICCNTQVLHYLAI